MDWVEFSKTDHLSWDEYTAKDRKVVVQTKRMAAQEQKLEATR